MADFPAIPAGFGIPLVDMDTYLFPEPTMDALSATIVEEAGALVDEGVTTRTADGAPIFVRLNSGNPIFTTVNQNPAGGASSPTTAASMFWMRIIDAKKLIGPGALDEFYMYYTTDHEGTHANSGAWLATAPTESGPWTGQGRKFIDNSGGTQTEEFVPFADPTGQYKLLALYQQAGVSGAVGGQSLKWAYSDDGIAWTIGGLAIDIPTWWPSDGDTGYPHVTVIGGTVWAHIMAGGGNTPRYALAQSTDGRVWSLQQALCYNMDQIGDGRHLAWNHGDVIPWHGRLWWIGQAATFASGTTPFDNRLIAAQLATDMRSIVSKPAVQLYPLTTEASTNYRSTYAFVARDGRLILYYNLPGGFYVAEAR